MGARCGRGHAPALRAENSRAGVRSGDRQARRAWQAIQDIIKNHPRHLVAAVAHNLCILSIICKAIDLDLNSFRRLKIETAFITEIIFTGHGPVLAKINDTAHLADNWNG